MHISKIAAKRKKTIKVCKITYVSDIKLVQKMQQYYSITVEKSLLAQSYTLRLKIKRGNQEVQFMQICFPLSYRMVMYCVSLTSPNMTGMILLCDNKS